MTEPMDERVKQIARTRSRVLIGLAHYDKGVKKENCDCCYCKPRKETDEESLADRLHDELIDGGSWPTRIWFSPYDSNPRKNDDEAR